MRLRTKSSPEAAGIARRREASIFHLSNSGITHTRSSPPPRAKNASLDRRLLPEPAVPIQQCASTVRSSQSSNSFGDGRILVPPHNLSLRNTVNVRDLTRKQSFAFERLESSISKLQVHSPHQTEPQPVIRPKNKLEALPITPSEMALAARARNSSTVMKPTINAASRARSSERSQPPHASRGRTNHGDRHSHTRSPSAPAAVVSPNPKLPSAPPFSLSQVRSVPTSHDDFYKRFGANNPGVLPPPPLPTPPPKQTNAEGLRSFMDVTPEQKPRPTHTRSRSSMAGAAAHAEKARKMLMRASISVANWGKGLTRSGSKKG